MRGVAMTIDRSGFRLRGANILIRGEIPTGAGLSSSASVEVAAGYALMKNSELDVDPRGACEARPTRRKRIRGRALRHYGSIHRVPGPGRPRAPARLPLARLLIRFLFPKTQGWSYATRWSSTSLPVASTTTRRAECEAGVRALAKKLPGIIAHCVT